MQKVYKNHVNILNPLNQIIENNNQGGLSAAPAVGGIHE